MLRLILDNPRNYFFPSISNNKLLKVLVKATVITGPECNWKVERRVRQGICCLAPVRTSRNRLHVTQAFIMLARTCGYKKHNGWSQPASFVACHGSAKVGLQESRGTEQTCLTTAIFGRQTKVLRFVNEKAISCQRLCTILFVLSFISTDFFDWMVCRKWG